MKLWQPLFKNSILVRFKKIGKWAKNSWQKKSQLTISFVKLHPHKYDPFNTFFSKIIFIIVFASVQIRGYPKFWASIRISIKSMY